MESVSLWASVLFHENYQFYDKDWASQVAQWVKNLPAMQETQEMQVWPLHQEGPLEEGMQPTPVFLPGDPPGQSGLVGYSP